MLAVCNAAWRPRGSGQLLFPGRVGVVIPWLLMAFHHQLGVALGLEAGAAPRWPSALARLAWRKPLRPDRRRINLIEQLTGLDVAPSVNRRLRMMPFTWGRTSATRRGRCGR